MHFIQKTLVTLILLGTIAEAGRGDLHLGAHFLQGTGANIGYTRLMDSGWLWDLDFDYGLLKMEVMDTENSLVYYPTKKYVGLLETKFTIGKYYELAPALQWNWSCGVGHAFLDGTMEGMPGKDGYMWAFPLGAQLVRYTDTTKDFGFFAGMNLTFHTAQTLELYDEMKPFLAQLRTGIVF